jgi:hypothetical protein
VTDRNLTHLGVIVDRSGSMHSIKQDMEGGFNSLIQKQRETPGQCKVTLAQFDTEYEVVYTDQDLASVPGLVINPRGRTALLDALGRFITDTGMRLSALPEDERPGLVIVAVITDGLENASHEYTLDQIDKMINHQRDAYQWMFVYLGANQDAIATGRSMGFARGQTMTYAATSHGTQSAYSATSDLITGTRMKVNSGMSSGEAVLSTAFTDKDRDAAVDKKETEQK